MLVVHDVVPAVPCTRSVRRNIVGKFAICLFFSLVCFLSCPVLCGMMCTVLVAYPAYGSARTVVRKSPNVKHVKLNDVQHPFRMGTN